MAVQILPYGLLPARHRCRVRQRVHQRSAAPGACATRSQAPAWPCRTWPPSPLRCLL